MNGKFRWLLIFSLVVSSACVPSIPSPQRSASPTASATAPAETAPAATQTSATRTPSAPAPTEGSPAATRISATRTPRPATPTREVPTPTPNPRYLETFEAVWLDVQQHYVYTDFRGLDWDAIHVEYRAFVEAATSDDEFYPLMENMIDALGDDHSYFLSPADARAQDEIISGTASYVGIGVSARVATRRSVTILQVYPGSPAEAAGLKAHDSLLEIAGYPAVDAAGVVHVDKLRGPEGTVVSMTVQSPGGQPRDLTVTRARVEAQLPVVVKRIEGDIAYVGVPAFEDASVTDRVVSGLAKLGVVGRPVKGIVLDMRLNPGGLFVPAKQLWSLFLGNGTAVYVLDHGTRFVVRITARDVHGSQTLPLVVLAGPYSESMGEVTAGVLQDMGRAKVVGMPTAGNVEVIDRINYPDGSRLWLAEQTLIPVHHRDAQWEGRGIQPDVVVDAPWDSFTEESDPQLQAAVDLLMADSP